MSGHVRNVQSVFNDLGKGEDASMLTRTLLPDLLLLLTVTGLAVGRVVGWL
jgi:hypothetical protein